MRHLSLVRALALAVCLTTAGEASAQLKPEPKAPPSAPSLSGKSKVTPAGNWRFETGQIAGVCKLSGTMQVWRAGGGGKYACRLTAYQTCTSGMIKKIKTSQSCGVEERGDKLYFSSRIDRIESVDPVEITEMVKINYAADNFLLALNKTGDEMAGMFISLSEAAVKFVRLEELVS